MLLLNQVEIPGFVVRIGDLPPHADKKTLSIRTISVTGSFVHFQYWSFVHFFAITTVYFGVIRENQNYLFSIFLDLRRKINLFRSYVGNHKEMFDIADARCSAGRGERV